MTPRSPNAERTVPADRSVDGTPPPPNVTALHRHRDPLLCCFASVGTYASTAQGCNLPKMIGGAQSDTSSQSTIKINMDTNFSSDLTYYLSYNGGAQVGIGGSQAPSKEI